MELDDTVWDVLKVSRILRPCLLFMFFVLELCCPEADRHTLQVNLGGSD